MNPDALAYRKNRGITDRDEQMAILVQRVSGDYARIVPLDNPAKAPPVNHEEERRYSQHRADVLNLRKNRHCDLLLEDLLELDLRVDQSLFFSVDFATYHRLQELGRGGPTPRILDFRKLLTQTEFPGLLKRVLAALETAYRYPVDVEFTCNFIHGDQPRFNLLQCRPLQTRGFRSTLRSCAT